MEYLNYELIKRKQVAFDTSKAKASSTYAGALGKEIKSGNCSQPDFANKSVQPFASLKICLREHISNPSIKDLQSDTMVLKKAIGVVMELIHSTATRESKRTLGLRPTYGAFHLTKKIC